jgi:hypothetical protein
MIFDFCWSVKAGWRAGDGEDVGHFWRWEVDRLYDVCEKYLGADEMKEFWPKWLREWRRVDTQIAPKTFRGVYWARLNKEGDPGEIPAMHLSCIVERIRPSWCVLTRLVVPCRAEEE